MDATILGPLLRSILLIVLFAAVVIPIKLILFKIIPDGKIKRILFNTRL